MSPERPQPPTAVMPIASIDDPRTITLLATEHWSPLGARTPSADPVTDRQD